MTNSLGEEEKTTVNPGDVNENRTRPTSSAARLAERYGVFGIIIAEILTFSILAPGTFPTVQNMQVIASAMSVMAIVALAILVPLVAGRFDVSVGASVSLCGVATVVAMRDHGFALVPAILIGVTFSVVLGIGNGIIIAYLGVNSIIATLGMASVVIGLLMSYTNGMPIYDGVSQNLLSINTKTVLGVPIIFLAALFLCLACWFLLTQSVFGKNLEAVGDNENAAILNGISAKRIVLTSFLVTGLFGGAAGILQVAFQGSGDPAVGSISFIMPALASVFLGATVVHPGKYNVPGTLAGLMFISITQSGLILLGLKPWVSEVFNGLAVVVAIAISAQLRRRRTGVVPIGH
ncbi:MAG: ABC transporter permease [Alcaligenaceae bacterium]|nr:MAG: ABC transporter permease [Alcaligenaceae bacterium]